MIPANSAAEEHTGHPGIIHGRAQLGLWLRGSDARCEGDSCSSSVDAAWSRRQTSTHLREEMAGFVADDLHHQQDQRNRHQGDAVGRNGAFAPMTAQISRRRRHFQSPRSNQSLPAPRATSPQYCRSHRKVQAAGSSQSRAGEFGAMAVWRRHCHRGRTGGLDAAPVFFNRRCDVASTPRCGS